MRAWHNTFIAVVSIGGVLGYTPCPLLGPGYPEPTEFYGDSSSIPAAWANLTSKIQTYLATNTSDGGVDVQSHSFSIGAFSVNDPTVQSKYQYHHSGTLVSNLTKSVSRVDGNSVYRIASISKLITVYQTLIRIGSSHWNRPITDFIPELARVANSSNDHPIKAVDWHGVTLGSLAGQISGVPRDVSYVFTDLAVRLKQSHTDPTTEGLPKVNISDPYGFPACNFFLGPPCNDTVFLQEFLNFAPTYEPWTSPTYADPSFKLLATALEKIVGKPFDDLLQNDLFEPLGLTSTSYDVPKNLSTGVIPGGDPAAVYYSTDVGPEKPVFGFYTSLNDLNALAISIMNSTLLPPEETRKWLKPITHTANGNLSVGRPWEIYRLSQPVTGRLNDLYTKDGSLGNYTSWIALSPDHGAGFNILVAGPQAQVVIADIKDMITETLLPAYEAQAAAEAKRNLAGIYVSTDPKNNASISFNVTPSSGPGLILSTWVNEGKDIVELISNSYFVETLDARLYPTSLVKKLESGESRISFRASFGDKSAAPPSGPFSIANSCGAWGQVDAIYYAEKALDQFIFQVDKNGKAISVTLPAVRATLQRSE